MADLEWHGKEAMDHVRQRAFQFLTRAAITVSRRAKELLSVPGTAYSSGHGGGRKGKRVYGAVRSEPGEPPRKQTGRLRASVTYEVDESSLSARVGTNVTYGKYLELGTKKGIKPRPWLRRALAEMQGKVDELLASIGS
jgi:HK97 gp10 family phage protein